MQNLSKTTMAIAGVQWLFFIFANTVVIPLSVGAAFHLPPEVIASTLRTSFIFTGIASIFQAFFGHRYPLLEGHSGLWWGLILSLCASASSVGMSYVELGGSLAAGMIMAGLMTIVLGVLGFTNVLKKIFNQVVMSVYLFLLSCQLIIIFFKGMLGIAEDATIDMKPALLSILLVIFVVVLNVKGKGKLSNFSILIGILAGWLAYSLFFPVSQQVNSSDVALFTMLPWGPLRLDMGIMMTAFLAGLINMTNSIVSISTAEKTFKRITSEKEYKWSFILTGFHSIVAGLLGLVPFGPYTSSLGFLESTRIFRRMPFMIGGGLLILLGLVPSLGAFFSMLPVSVGNAVLFVAYLQLFGTALRNIQTIQINSKTIYRLAISALVGLSIMNIPAETFAPFPMLVRPLISNGLLVGVLLSVMFEVFGDWKKYEQQDLKESA